MYQRGLCRAHGFQVTEVFLDSECGLVALNEIYQLRVVRLTYAPPGQHASLVERKIGLVSEMLVQGFADSGDGSVS